MNSTEIIEKIRAVVNRQRTYYNLNNPYDKRAIRVCNNIISVLGDLEKEEKPIEGLEEEIDKVYLKNRVVGYVQGVGEILLGREAFAIIARHFYELGRQSKPKVYEGLEEEIYRWWGEEYIKNSEGLPILPIVQGIARHFAKWGAENAKKDEISVSDDLEEASYKYHRTHTDEVMVSDGYHNDHTKEVYDVTPGESFITGAKWQKEQMMIQWTGNNLKDLIEFTGKSPRFNEWFKSWDDYEDYVRQHGNIFKMFNDDGSNLEVPVGAWIVKTPDKRCVASKFTLKQPESEKIAAAYQLGLADKEKMMMKEAVEGWVSSTQGDHFGCVTSVPTDLGKLYGADKCKIIIVKED